MTDLRSDWQKRQAALCSCKGTDDYCPCQNVDFTAPRPTQPSIGMDEREKIAREVLDKVARDEGWGGTDMRFAKQDQPTIIRAMLAFADRLALSATTASVGEVVCRCQGVEIGSYDAQVELATPPHMARDDGRGICIDSCLALEVTKLWSYGITTTGCCCGHGKAPPYIGVIESDIIRMKALGYVIAPNALRPGAEDSFTPIGARALHDRLTGKDRG